MLIQFINIPIFSYTSLLAEVTWNPFTWTIKDLFLTQMINIFGAIINSIYYLTAFSINILQSTSSVRLVTENIYSGWNQSMFYVNVIAVFFLIALALATSLRLNIETYEIKKTLPNLIIGFILANFSLLLCRAVLDLSDVITYQLTLDAGGGGNLAARIIELVTGIQFDPGKGITLDDSSVEMVLTFFASFSQFSPSAGVVAYLGVMLMAALWFSIPAIIITVLAIVMIIRYIILMIMVVVAPIAVILFFFPATQSLGSRWFDEFFKWAFLPPIVFFVLRMATFFDSGSNTISQNTKPIILPNQTTITSNQNTQHSNLSLQFITTAHAQTTIDRDRDTDRDRLDNDSDQVDIDRDRIGTDRSSNTTDRNNSDSDDIGAISTGSSADTWNNVLGYFAGIGILVAAIYIPFQIGGVGGHLMNYAGSLGRWAAISAGQRGARYLDNRFAVSERAKRTFAGTRWGQNQQKYAINRKLIAEDTEGKNKKTQQEHLWKKKDQMLKDGKSGTEEYKAIMKQYRALTKELYTPAAEHQTLDTHEAELDKLDKKHPGAINAIVNNQPFPPGSNIGAEDEGKIRAALWGITNATKDWDEGTRKKAESLEEKYMPNSNRDHFGPLSPHKDSYDQAAFRAIKSNITDPVEQQEALRMYSTSGTLPPSVDVNKITADANKFAGSKEGATFTLDQAWTNNFNKKVENKAEAVVAAMPKARFNNAKLGTLKRHIDNGEFNEAHNFAKANNMLNIAPNLDKMKKNSIEQATISVSLEEIMNANNTVFSGKPPSSTEPNSVSAKIQNNIQTQFDNQVNSLKTNHDSARKSIGKIANNFTSDGSTKFKDSTQYTQVIGDLKDKGKYSKDFMQEFLPEINSTNRTNLEDKINELGDSYKDVVAQRIVKLSEGVPAKKPRPKTSGTTDSGIHIAGTRGNVRDKQVY